VALLAGELLSALPSATVSFGGRMIKVLASNIMRMMNTINDKEKKAKSKKSSMRDLRLIILRRR